MTYQGETFLLLRESTAGSVPPHDVATFRKLAARGTSGVQAWKQATTYKRDQAVTYNNELFLVVKPSGVHDVIPTDDGTYYQRLLEKEAVPELTGAGLRVAVLAGAVAVLVAGVAIGVGTSDAMKVFGGLVAATGFLTALLAEMGDDWEWKVKTQRGLRLSALLLSIVGAALFFAAEFTQVATRILIIGAVIPVLGAALIGAVIEAAKGHSLGRNVLFVCASLLGLGLAGWLASERPQLAAASERQVSRALLSAGLDLERQYAAREHVLTDAFELDLRTLVMKDSRFERAQHDADSHGMTFEVSELSHDRKRAVLTVQTHDRLLLRCTAEAITRRDETTVKGCEP